MTTTKYKKSLELDVGLGVCDVVPSRLCPKRCGQYVTKIRY